MKHVRSQIAMYVDGRLTAREAHQVQAHVLTCAECSDALSRHKQIAHDIRLALTVSPRAEQITGWWRAIQAEQVPDRMSARRYEWASTAMLPTLLAVSIIVLPMLLGLTGQVSRTAAASGTYSVPAAVVTNLPPTGQTFQTQEPLDSHAVVLLAATYSSPPSAESSSTVTSVDATPAPLAP